MTHWPRTLIFSANAPPSFAASAQVSARLVSGAEEYFGFVHRKDGISRKSIISEPVIINYALKSIFRLPVVWRFEQYAWYHAAISEGLRQTAQSKWDVIMACHPNMAFSLAAAKVAKIRDLPLVLYLMDTFSESRTNPVEKLWAGTTEKKLMNQASKVICLTKGLQEHYSRKYKISPVLIPHSVTGSELAKAGTRKPDLGVGSPVNITYAGGVYQARLDSLLAVKHAVDQLNADGFPAVLNILGKNDSAELSAWGIGGKFVKVRFIRDREQFTEQLCTSDILLSTIAFDSDYPLQDQTCFPTKTMDYFLVGKPVMVIAPEQSDYVAYLNDSMTAVTVCTLDSGVIAREIMQLSNNMQLRQSVVKCAYDKLIDHDQISLQKQLNDILLASVRSTG